MAEKISYRLTCRAVDHNVLSQIKAFLVLADGRLAGQWGLETTKPADAYLIPADENTVRIFPAEHAREPGTETVLRTPLQLEEFLDAMRRIEIALRATNHLRVVPVPARPDSPLRDDMPLRLLRWPPVQLLTRHKYYPRLASFLFARPVTVSRLSLLSNVPTGLCHEFVDSVRPLGILDVAGTAPVPGTAAPAASTVRLNLVQRLRAKLGLGVAHA